MKALLTVGFLPCLTVLAALTAPCVSAQSEIDPDHFESPNTWPFSRPKPNAASPVAETRYERRFALPYSVLCSGNKLAPGKYAISLRSDGKVGQATLSLKGQTVGIAGVVQRQSHKRGSNTLIIEAQGKIRSRSALQVAEFDFVFDLYRQTESLSKSKPRHFEKLPFTLLPPTRRHGTAG